MKSILIVGMGRFGKHVAAELSELGHEVMAVDKDEDKINDVLAFVTNAQIGDSTKPDFLNSLGIDNYDLCIVTIGNNFQSSLETTALLKELGASFVIARASRDVHAKFLLRNGADKVVYPEKQIAKWTAIRYSSGHILDYFELDDGQAVFETSVPDKWLGSTIGQLDVRRKFAINIMAIKEDKKLDLSITPDTVLHEGQTLLVIGSYQALQKCFHDDTISSLLFDAGF